VFNDLQGAIDKLATLCEGGGVKYVVFQEEISPQTKKHHLQGYLQWCDNQKWDRLKRELKDDTVHIERARGSPQQNYDYCTKLESRVPDSTPWEYGEMQKDQGKRNDMHESFEMIKSGASEVDVLKAHPGTAIRYFKGLAMARDLLAPDRECMTACLIMWGASGSGKSTIAKECFPGACWIAKQRADWWFDGYSGQDVVIFDEFCGEMTRETFKRLIDHTPLRVEMKGATRKWRPKLAVFISNIDPRTWWANYKDAEERISIERRMHIVLRAKRVIEPQALVNPSWTSSEFALSVDRFVIPWMWDPFKEWKLPGLTTADSAAVIGRKTKGSNTKDAFFACRPGPGSEGVILTPSLPPNLPFQTSAPAIIRRYLLGDASVADAELQLTQAASAVGGEHGHDSDSFPATQPFTPVLNRTTPTGVVPPVLSLSPRELEQEDWESKQQAWLASLGISSGGGGGPPKKPIRHDQVNTHKPFKTNYPEFGVDTYKKQPPRIAHKNKRLGSRRRLYKNPYIDDEAIEDGGSTEELPSEEDDGFVVDDDQPIITQHKKQRLRKPMRITWANEEGIHTYDSEEGSIPSSPNINADARWDD